MITNSIILHYGTENEHGETIYTSFRVDAEWLRHKVVDSGDYESIEDFLNEYTSDDSIDVYCDALLDDAIDKNSIMHATELNHDELMQLKNRIA